MTCVAGNISWINSPTVSFSLLTYTRIFMTYQGSTAGDQALFLRMFHSFQNSFSSRTKTPGSPSHETDSLQRLLQGQGPGGTRLLMPTAAYEDCQSSVTRILSWIFTAKVY